MGMVRHRRVMLLLEMSSVKLLFLGSFVLHGAVCFFFFSPDYTSFPCWLERELLVINLAAFWTHELHLQKCVISTQACLLHSGFHKDDIDIYKWHVKHSERQQNQHLNKFWKSRREANYLFSSTWMLKTTRCFVSFRQLFLAVGHKSQVVYHLCGRGLLQHQESVGQNIKTWCLG